MSDMLVNLYDLKDNTYEKSLNLQSIIVKKALIPDKTKILEFIKTNFSERWANECEYALFNNPISCYIAVYQKEVIGFACYDATAKGFFGPIGVKQDFRGKGVGKVLLNKCLISMKEIGYGYAIIGWAAEDAIDFYKRETNAIIIDNSETNKSVYKNLIDME